MSNGSGILLTKDNRIGLAAGVLVVVGLSLVVYAGLLEAGLWYILLRKVLVALGGGIAVLGGIIGLVRRYRPLTPIRAWLIPFGVMIAVGGLTIFDLIFHFGLDDLQVVLKPTQGILVGSAFSIPVGAALRRNDFSGATVAGTGGLLLYFWVWGFLIWDSPSVPIGGIAMGLVALSVLAIPQSLVGFLLTPPVTKYGENG